MTLKSDAKFEEKLTLSSKNMILKSGTNFEDFLFQKWQKFGEFSSEHLKIKKNCTLIGPFCAKYITFDLKKYRGYIFQDTEDSCKIWRKTDLWFGKWHEKFCKFSSEHLKVSKLVLSWDPLVQSRKCIS